MQSSAPLGIRLFAVLLLVVSAGRIEAQAFKVVANGSTEVGDLTSAGAARIFLKQDKKFASGTAAVPVDQAKASAPRAAFSKDVLGKTVAVVETYWQQQLFAGRDTPPDSKPSDDEVIAFVKSTPGAIGYVSAGAAVPSGVKVVAIK